ncbi:SDR family NAD(P)-dependent oxidoreductase, partial [Streptomyces sp. 5-10]|nr:SDR family NAD(P)-dependent oxidoreductase [Streptomyces sp. 5-10]
FRLLESWGVRPDYLVGHSIGEVAAAYVAGMVSLADACVLVGARGRLMQALPSGGAMVAVQAPVGEVVPLLSGGVEVAAVNGPVSVVVSGVEGAVAEVVGVCAGRGWKTRRLGVSHAFHSALMEPMLEEFARALEGMRFGPPRIPVVSTVTGEPLSEVDAGYWVGQVRRPVRFADAVACVAEAGVRTFLEVGPDAALTPMVEQTVDDASVVPASRRDRDEATTLITALARLHTNGVPIAWEEFFAGTGARRVDLPTYAFQHRSYWLKPQVADDVSRIGQRAVEHPLLRAAIARPDSDGAILTGRVSVEGQPWLADHTVLGRVLLPGTAFVEMAVRAADHVGCDLIEDLILQAPLALPERGGVSVQVVVGAMDESGETARRTVKVYSRQDEAADDLPWTLHAEGSLVSGAVPPGFDLAEWPPPNATPMVLDGFYDRLADQGYGYGPAFQGMRAAWRRGDEVFAEVSLPAPVDAESERYGLHPALLDTGLHAGLVADGESSGATVLPFAWSGVALHATGASVLRVRIAPGERGTVAVEVADGIGRPVLSTRSLAGRPVTADQLGAGRAGGGDLYRVTWSPLPADRVPTGEPGGDTAGVTVLEVETLSGDVPARARETAERTLGTLQEWLGDEQRAESVLVVVTRGAMSTVPGEDVDLGAAPVWGLVRAAQAENPGRFVLVDVDGSEESARLLPAVAGLAEPECALREGRVLVPRLARAAAEAAASPPRLDGNGTVLVTGGVGGLGAVVARHLAARFGVRRLLLLSRRGPTAPGAAELRAELAALGAEATILACDVGDRNGLAEALDAVPDEHPLTGIVHAAGVIDNALVGTQTPVGLGRVMSAKADAAWHLHDLTATANLAMFVMFSSAGGMVLAAGQATYAAANVFLDALAAHRRAAGLPAQSQAWGLWSGAGMERMLTDADRHRMRRQGLPPIPVDDALALFDAALGRDDALLVPLRVDHAALRARTGEIPPLLRGLTPASARRSASAGVDAAARSGLLDRLDGRSDADRRRVLLDEVRAQAAAVLGHERSGAVDTGRGFLDIGFDSLTALELRTRLTAVTGHRLPPTLVFDYPTVAAVAEYLHTEFFAAPDASGPELDEATAEELFGILDNELGLSG